MELVHNFSLIHDDIEDDDTERRGHPTVWAKYGLPHGVNTGDGMMALANIMLENQLSMMCHPAMVQKLQRILNTAVLEMIIGQYHDLTLTVDCSLPDYEAMIARKTGALMMAAAEMGSRIGAANAIRFHRLYRQLGWHLGVAFQMQNDLVGTWQGTDIEKHKVALPVILALQSPLHQEFREIFALPRVPKERILAIYEQAKIQRQCQELVSQQLDRARSILTELRVAHVQGIEPLQQVITSIRP